MPQYEVKVSKIGGSLRVTIPAELTKLFGLRAGDTLVATLDNGGILFHAPGQRPVERNLHCPRCGKVISAENISHGPGSFLTIFCPHCKKGSFVEGLS